MLLLPSFTALCALASIPLAAAQREPYPITGVWSGVNSRTGETPARRNINDLYQEAGPQWDLYVQAMTVMQEADISSSTSYFQIAAIHGQPYMPWQGGGPQRGNGGFCPHNEILFGTWHRGYLALFEQVLVSHARRIAESYPTSVRQQYVTAAARLRVPYWDWAADSRVPPSTVPQTVRVNRADGTRTRRVDVRNPLVGYTYPAAATSQRFGRFNGSNSTKRCVEPGESYPATPNRDLTARDLRTHVYNALTRASSFPQISSMSMGGNSLEGPHGTIHIYAACGQDFYYLSTSAFDPLFMLHHANVDRLLAFWQALNYQNGRVQFSYQTGGLFGTPSGTTITESSPIAPFDGEGGPLTSLDVANIRDWGYTYEPLRHWEATPGQMRTEITREINRLYGPRQSSRLRLPLGAERKRQDRAVEREYFAKIEVERSELSLPAAVDIYVQKKHAGTFALLGMPEAGMSYDEIPLHHVLEQMTLNVTSSEDVARFIQGNMEVNIKKPDGTDISLASVPSLKIQIEDIDVMMPSTEEELPEFGASKVRTARPKTLIIKRVEVVVPC